MKLLVLILALTACCVHARPGGHGWAQQAPQGPPQVIHVIRESVQAAHVPQAAPVSVI